MKGSVIIPLFLCAVKNINSVQHSFFLLLIFHSFHVYFQYILSSRIVKPSWPKLLIKRLNQVKDKIWRYFCHMDVCLIADFSFLPFIDKDIVKETSFLVTFFRNCVCSFINKLELSQKLSMAMQRVLSLKNWLDSGLL